MTSFSSGKLRSSKIESAFKVVYVYIIILIMLRCKVDLKGEKSEIAKEDEGRIILL